MSREGKSGRSDSVYITHQVWVSLLLLLMSRSLEDIELWMLQSDIVTFRSPKPWKWIHVLGRCRCRLFSQLGNRAPSTRGPYPLQARAPTHTHQQGMQQWNLDLTSAERHGHPKNVGQTGGPSMLMGYTTKRYSKVMASVSSGSGLATL